jgi:hypothetical protein
MARTLTLKTFSDNRGSLGVIEDHEIPFTIKRLFYIYNVTESKRAGHRHKNTSLALISVQGGFKAYVNNGKEVTTYNMDSPSHCLVLEPADWHLLYDFAPGTVLLACASEYFNDNDYIFEEYK